VAALQEPLTLRIDLPLWSIVIFLFALGAICGSFLNVCVYRLPKYDRFWPSLTGLWSPPSSCPRCRTHLAWHDNFPVLGWLLLRGRCRTCRMWISPQYPIVELLNGLLFIAVYLLEVPTGIWASLADSCLYTELGPQTYPGLGWLSPEWWVHLRYAYHMVLIEALLVASLIDFKLKIIPDGCTLPAMAVGVVAALAIGRLNLVPVWFQDPRVGREAVHVLPDWMQWLSSSGPRVPEWIAAWPHLHGLAASLAGLLAGGGIVWIVRAVGSSILKREAMGDGDVVLMAMVGSFIGWQPVIIAFFLAPVGALLYVIARMAFRWHEEIPYGPFLSLGTLATLLGWQTIWPAFERMFLLGPLLLVFFAGGLVLFVVILLAMQFLKRLLGIPLGPPPEPVAWTAADQTHFFAGEQVDRHACRWRTTGDWVGTASSRGSLHHERWRHPSTAGGTGPLIRASRR
jgi:leader peptidase (prepilin peptidase)/N-methyltransferase